MLSLRRVNDTDQDQMLEWRNRDDIARWMYTDHQITREEHAAWFSRMVDDDLQRYWVVSWQSQPIGIVHLTGMLPAHRRSSWGIYIAEPSARGTGAAEAAAFLSLDYAFSEMCLERVSCESLWDNQRALALYERVGFRREAHLRAHIRRGNVGLDVVGLGLLASEWATLRPGLLERLVRRGVLTEGPSDG